VDINEGGTVYVSFGPAQLIARHQRSASWNMERGLGGCPNPHVPQIWSFQSLVGCMSLTSSPMHCIATEDGHLVHAVGYPSTSDDLVEWPYGVDVDSHGRVLVTDRAPAGSMYSMTGTISSPGARGPNPESSRAGGICVGSDG
jgi:hypothetical protein